MKPILGITMGDPTGIGSEIIVKALENNHIYSISHPIVIGDEKIPTTSIKNNKLFSKIKNNTTR